MERACARWIAGSSPAMTTEWLRPNERNMLLAIKIAQIRRLLIAFGGHQVSIGADHVELLAHEDMRVVLGTVDKIPHRMGVALVDAVDGPWAREGVVFDGDLVAQQVPVGFVQLKPLSDHSLVVLVQAHPAAFKRPWSFEAARFDLQHIVAAVAVCIEPLAD